MREWKVLKNGEIWSDRFNTLEDAEDYVNGLVNSGHSGRFEVIEMTEEDINQYYS